MHNRFLLFFILIAIALCQPALALSDNVFTVKNINVDVTSSSAADARENAFNNAQLLAFEELINRVLPEELIQSFEMPELSTVSLLVKDYEITEEKLSSVRYIGTYTFRFKEDKVKEFLDQSGMYYTDVGSKPILVIPFFQTATHTLLWNRDENPWLQAWSRNNNLQGLVPFVVPIGDLEDVSTISDNGLIAYDHDAMQNMVSRYNAGEASLISAIPQWTGTGHGDSETPDYVDIHIYSTAGTLPRLSSTLKITAAEGETDEQLYDRIVNLVRNTFQQKWKDRTLVDPNQSNSIRASVKFVSMSEWIETQKALNKVAGINEVKLLSISPNEASVELKFQGSAQRLRLALLQVDLILSSPVLRVSVKDIHNPYLNNPFNNMGNQQAGTPLVYDLYLSKYKQR
jgi:hypothetical protein